MSFRLSQNAMLRRLIYNARLHQRDILELRSGGLFRPGVLEKLILARSKRNAFMDSARIVGSELGLCSDLSSYCRHLIKKGAK